MHTPHKILRRLAVVLLIAMVMNAPHANAANTTLHGVVGSGDENGLADYKITLYAVYGGGDTQVLGRATSGAAGEFNINYKKPGEHTLLFIFAKKDSVWLVSALGEASTASDTAVVNERTTVATGIAFAQFVHNSKFKGNRYGMRNAAKMVGNLINTQTGSVADVLGLPPNGSETTALRTFNSLANIVADCVKTPAGCQALFEATTPPGEASPKNVLQAVANITKYPWLNVSALFNLSFAQPVFEPALAQNQPPDAWNLFLKFTGSFSSVQDENNLLNGPGAFAIDRKGYIWVNDNYIPQPPNVAACAGTRLLKFYPWGENYPGSPYFGGGLLGAGFGITLDPKNRVWVGNFGFAGTGCPLPPANSVSVFDSNGTPLSPDNGYASNAISWPQATLSDRKGNIWVANCATDSVTVYTKGNIAKELNIPITPPANDEIRKMKPFGMAIDNNGNAWVAGSFNSTLAVVGRDGRVHKVFPSTDSSGTTQLRRPLGVASDSKGNIWVANSDFVNVPCPPSAPVFGPATQPSIALFIGHPKRQPDAQSPFTGGGLTLPWGIAVDGNDTVWVANFGFPFDLNPETDDAWPAPNRVSHFCGVNTSKCPPTKRETGKAISPDGSGYTSDALDRNTGIAIDPSGNVWLANNWKAIPLLNNPGGNSIAVLIGAAAPLKTPLIGAPRSFAR